MLQEPLVYGPHGKSFKSCSMVPSTTNWRYQLTALAALLYTSQLFGGLRSSEPTSRTSLMRTDRIAAQITPNHSAWPVGV